MNKVRVIKIIIGHIVSGFLVALSTVFFRNTYFEVCGIKRYGFPFPIFLTEVCEKERDLWFIGVVYIILNSIFYGFLISMLWSLALKKVKMISDKNILK